MSMITFLCGMGAGALLATLILLALIFSIIGNYKKASAEAQTYNKDTLAKMKERNELDKLKVQSLGKIADWCDHNWNFTKS